MAGKSRPILVTLVGILFALIAIFSLVVGIILCATGNVDLYSIGLDEETIKQIEEILRDAGVTFSSLMYAAGAVYIVFGLIYAFLSLGNFKGWGFIWFLAIVVMAISLVLNIIECVSLFNAGTILGIVIDILILAYLFTPKVKKFFLG